MTKRIVLDVPSGLPADRYKRAVSKEALERIKEEIEERNEKT